MNAVNAVMGILILVIVGAVSIPMLQDVGDTSTAPGGTGWEYDDYAPAEGVSSASGALELVVVDGTTMVHAHDVGDGSMTMSDGTTTHVEVSPAVLDVFLMTGQSNSSYRTDDPSAASPVPEIGTAYIWADSSGDFGDRGVQSDFRFMPMVSPSGELNTGDTAPAFASEVHAITDGKVYFVCGGIGARSIDTFDPDAGSTWVHMKHTLALAMDSIPKGLFHVRTICYMWIQGEADLAMPVETYKLRFMEMHDAILDGELGYTFSHCFISLMPSEYANPREAQIQLAQEHPESISIGADLVDGFTVDNGLMQSDGVHYTQLGDNLIGEALGVACGEYLLENPVPIPSEEKGIRSLFGLMPTLLALVIGILSIGIAFKVLTGRD